ncbi:MAG: hypothetical protein M3Z85_19515, partial [Acidobacteriota bacterium]|nr:hypothetical protein [Acidobacteriota bacterium]
MKVFSAIIFVACFVSVLPGNETVDRAAQSEKSGDVAAARDILAKAAQASPNDPDVLGGYAGFLDRYNDPGSRAAYRKLLASLQSSTGDKRAASIQQTAQRLVLLDLLAGDRAAATQDLAAYRAAGGTEWQGATISTSDAPPEKRQFISIPGPLRSFGRMAAISGDINPDDVLPALARNVVTNGYQASHSNDALEQTEYLKLVHRYISQARELEKLAGASKVIDIETCESPQAGEILRIIGFRMRGGCGSEVVLETVNATRAFLATDSGFPIAELEQSLRSNRPFHYDFKPTQVPVLYNPDYWVTAKEKGNGEFIDAFLGDPSLCRFYLGMAKLDQETADALRKDIPMMRLRAYAHVLDFFGGMFEIRNGKAVTPGGARSTAIWGKLVGAPPDKGSAFFAALLAKDDGWLASLYDALARVRGPVQSYLTDPSRMERFYTAVRGRVTSPGPARPVFRSNADMMLLTTRLRIDPNGQPHIPGNLDIWKNLFINHPHGKYDGKLTKLATGWKEPDDVLEALFGLSRKAVENEPLKIFMTLTDLDRNRARPLAPNTVDRLARSYKLYGAQYAIFNDAPSVSDQTIQQFIDTAESIDHMKDVLLRQNTAATAQALVGMWQIFSRQGSLPVAKANDTLALMLKPFSEVRNDRELFDGGRAGVKLLLSATGGNPNDPAPQDRLIGLLAGASNPGDSDAHTQMVQEMQHILDAQRIISLNTLFQLADSLAGQKVNAAVLGRLAARVAEIQLPRASLSGAEKNALAFGYWTERHIESERKLNVRAAISKAANDPEKLNDIRGSLAPFLRDALVAYNYVHYAPPGAQILYTNPLFVRGHDFIGMQGSNHTWKATELFGTGWPSNGGGRLIGSMAGLPYALAEAEQNFLIPTQTQALIWGDLVPQMVLSAKIPRWWNVTPAQIHWVGLHMRYAESLLAGAVLNPDLRNQVIETLGHQAVPARTLLAARDIDAGDVRGAIARLTPSELYVLTSEMLEKRPSGTDVLSAELQTLKTEHASEVSDAAISKAFGTPKPTLANSYRPELLRLRTFPTLMGYSSRIMAESWESNTLYWAALADQMHVAPSQLNVLIPEWTQKVVERIFASHLEDWPALLKS